MKGVKNEESHTQNPARVEPSELSYLKSNYKIQQKLTENESLF